MKKEYDLILIYDIWQSINQHKKELLELALNKNGFNDYLIHIDNHTYIKLQCHFSQREILIDKVIEPIFGCSGMSINSIGNFAPELPITVLDASDFTNVKMYRARLAINYAYFLGIESDDTKYHVEIYRDNKIFGCAKFDSRGRNDLAGWYLGNHFYYMCSEVSAHNSKNCFCLPGK